MATRMAVALPLLTTSALGILILCRKLTKRPLTDEQEAKLQKLIKRYKDQLVPSAERLAELEVEFQQQMKDGLAKQITVDGKHMMMLPTYIHRLPDGTETGECYALVSDCAGVAGDGRGAALAQQSRCAGNAAAWQGLGMGVSSTPSRFERDGARLPAPVRLSAAALANAFASPPLTHPHTPKHKHT